MSDNEALHTRINYMEEKFDSGLNQLTEVVKENTATVAKLVDAVTDFRVVEERVNRNSAQIKEQDRRQDEVDKRLPIYDLYVEKIKRIEIAVYIFIILAILGLIIA